MIDVFFSYSSADRDRVRPIFEALAALDYQVFWDQEVPAGSDWDTWIREQLTSSRAAVVFWSAQSVASDNVRHEATVAKQGATAKNRLPAWALTASSLVSLTAGAAAVYIFHAVPNQQLADNAAAKIELARTESTATIDTLRAEKKEAEERARAPSRSRQSPRRPRWRRKKIRFYGLGASKNLPRVTIL